MAVFPVQVDIQLAGDHMIDAVILQWHTELDHGPSCFSAVPGNIVTAKTNEFNRLAAWLTRDFDPTAPVRPLFIVIPEVSFPTALLQTAASLIQSLRRPCVFIAGLSHLSWQEYTALLSDCPNMPTAANWTEGGTQGNFVNAAAIYIYNGSSTVPLAKYLQLKVQPYRDEAPQLHRGQHTLLFRSTNQASGARINFAVKICSDFVNPTAVREFRQEVELAAASLPLDFTFVLQYQDDPEQLQFKQSVMAYFEPPVQMVETSLGALLFVNNGNTIPGRSQQFGGSRLSVAYRQLFKMSRDMACPTCVGTDQRAHGHQAVVFREAGPCVYHLTLKPIYLTNSRPGQDDDYPFRPGLCAPLDPGATRLQFDELQPICHWIESEWRDDEPDFLTTIGGHGGTADEMVAFQSFVRVAHQKTRASWKREMGKREIEVRDEMKHYTDIFSSVPNCPSTEAEPWLWTAPVSRAARRLMRMLTLINVGLQGTVDLNFPANLRLRHGMIGSTLALTFLYGDSSHGPLQLLNRFMNLKDRFGLGEFNGPSWLLVLVDPGATLSAEDLKGFKNGKITRAPDNQGPIGNGSNSTGSVVRAEQDLEVLSSFELTNVLTSTANAVALQGGLRHAFESRLK